MIAATRIPSRFHDVIHVSDLKPVEVSALISGDNVVLVKDVDQELFEHFVKTADFQKWMLYLHPSQREFANTDFPGPVRLAGVSGSEKTCVLIHRALRLAEKYEHGEVLILTLNAALTVSLNA